ncbi:hypothetical protein ACP8HI_11075 [Paenibacillus sp. FA6]|uniref:hypothetical protein n=1 Tax=Paenibacillus sp. FA6 TaxID=3413029 RepID=UPI003F65C8B5
MGDLEMDVVLEEIIVDEAELSELSDPTEDLTEEILSEDSAEEEVEEVEVEDVEDEDAEDSLEDDEDLI